MSRSIRLLNLIQALRRRRHPVTAAVLAHELGVSPRSIYRDIDTLCSQGAPIKGEAGIGYVLRPGFFLPPLMFSEDELDAVVLGLALAAQRGDEALAAAAADALAKVGAMLPPARAEAATVPALLAPAPGGGRNTLAILRRAIHAEHKLQLDYADRNGAGTRRIVWPVAVGFFETSEVLAAWCETRADFRHFRLDRIVSAAGTGMPYPRRRRILLAEWRAGENID